MCVHVCACEGECAYDHVQSNFLEYCVHFGKNNPGILFHTISPKVCVYVYIPCLEPVNKVCHLGGLETRFSTGAHTRRCSMSLLWTALFSFWNTNLQLAIAPSCTFLAKFLINFTHTHTTFNVPGNSYECSLCRSSSGFGMEVHICTQTHIQPFNVPGNSCEHTVCAGAFGTEVHKHKTNLQCTWYFMWT